MPIGRTTDGRPFDRGKPISHAARIGVVVNVLKESGFRAGAECAPISSLASAAAVAGADGTSSAAATSALASDTDSNPRGKKRARPVQGKASSPRHVWLVFVTEEEGGNGYHGCYHGGYDNGSHSAKLVGVYGSAQAANTAADACREEDDDDSENDGEQCCRHRSVGVTKVEVRDSHKAADRCEWSFVADTDLDAPCNY
jgi:hypothetical protein